VHPEDRNRMLIMIMLAGAAMLIMSHYMNRGEQQGGPTTTSQAPEQPSTAVAQPPAQPVPAATDIRQEGDIRPVVVTTDSLVVRLSPVGASVEKLELPGYHKNRGETAPLLLLNSADPAEGRGYTGPRRSLVLRGFKANTGAIDFENWPFRLESDDDRLAGQEGTRRIVFRARRGTVEVVKTYLFRRSGFDIELGVAVTNHAAERDSLEYRLIGPAGMLPDEPKLEPGALTAKLAGRGSVTDDMEFRELVAADAPDTSLDRQNLSQNRTEWAALRGRFFGVILAPLDPETTIKAFAEPLDQEQPDKSRRNMAVGVEVRTLVIDPGRAESRGFLLRAGPMIAEQLEAYEVRATGREPVNRGMIKTITFSWSLFDRPARWMLSLLEWSRNAIGNYGWGIVLMTLIVKLCLHPLQRKGMIVMQRNQDKMQALAPKMKELQEQYKDDQAKLQQAMMRLYKEEGFNPAGMALGCLPMMLQMPVWIALYGSIMGAFGLRQAEFLWIGDLSRPDTIVHFSFWPHDLNLLPILYAGLMAAQSFMTPLPADPQQRQQAWMMRFLPLMFFFFFYSLSSAFVLYFVTNGALGILETWMIKKQIARAKAREAAKSGAPGAAAGPAGKDAPKPAPVTDPAAFWAKEAEDKLGKGRK